MDIEIFKAVFVLGYVCSFSGVIVLLWVGRAHQNKIAEQKVRIQDLEQTLIDNGIY